MTTWKSPVGFEFLGCAIASWQSGPFRPVHGSRRLGLAIPDFVIAVYDVEYSVQTLGAARMCQVPAEPIVSHSIRR
jgi:hypothetical protein